MCKVKANEENKLQRINYEQKRSNKKERKRWRGIREYATKSKAYRRQRQRTGHRQTVSATHQAHTSHTTLSLSFTVSVSVSRVPCSMFYSVRISRLLYVRTWAVASTGSAPHNSKNKKRQEENQIVCVFVCVRVFSTDWHQLFVLLLT